MIVCVKWRASKKLLDKDCIFNPFIMAERKIERQTKRRKQRKKKYRKREREKREKGKKERKEEKKKKQRKKKWKKEKKKQRKKKGDLHPLSVGPLEDGILHDKNGHLVYELACKKEVKFLFGVDLNNNVISCFIKRDLCEYQIQVTS